MSEPLKHELAVPSLQPFQLIDRVERVKVCPDFTEQSLCD